MKKSIFIGILIFSLLSTPAFAGGYIGGNIGYSSHVDSDWTDPAFSGVALEVEADSGLAFGIFGGYDFGMFRAEIELARQKNDLDSVSGPGGSLPLSGDVTSTTALINGYIDFHNKSRFTPFISAGLGFAKVELNDFTIPGSGLTPADEDDTVFAGQIGVGVGIALNPNFNLDLKYRFFMTEDLEIETSEIEYSSHNVYLGIRYAF